MEFGLLVRNPYLQIRCSSITINCCDAESGVSPGTLSICENGTFNLIDELGAPVDCRRILDRTYRFYGLTRVVPETYGTFDPTSDPAGEYTYNVFGTDNCISSTTLIMEFNTLV